MIEDVLVAALATSASPGGRGLAEAVMEWADVATTWELVLVAFGVGAQLLFMGRWVVQWIAAERRGESHVPELFWWLSLSGATLLFVYFTLRGEPVGMLGQSIGWIIYVRNIHLIRHGRRAGGPVDA